MNKRKTLSLLSVLSLAILTSCGTNTADGQTHGTNNTNVSVSAEEASNVDLSSVVTWDSSDDDFTITTSDGTYTVKMYDACVFPDANSRIDAAGQHTPDQSADYKPFEFECTFTVANGTISSGINNISISSKVGGIYNIAGQQMNGLQKGINIVGGQKILVK